MHKTINSLITKHAYTSYLEIGVARGNTFMKVECRDKRGCDPQAGGFSVPPETVVYWTTSDEMWKTLPRWMIFDIVFIDGLHLAEQVALDIANTLGRLRHGGSIVVHDVNPATKEAQERHPPSNGGAWNGDVWRAWVPIVQESANAYTLMAGHGLGVWEGVEPWSAPYVRRPASMTWEAFDVDRTTYLRGRP